MKIEGKIKNGGRFIQGDQGVESGIRNYYVNEDKWQHFIVGDIDFILIKDTINVLNLNRRGMGMVFGCGCRNKHH